MCLLIEIGLTQIGLRSLFDHSGHILSLWSEFVPFVGALIFRMKLKRMKGKKSKIEILKGIFLLLQKRQKKLMLFPHFLRYAKNAICQRSFVTPICISKGLNETKNLSFYFFSNIVNFYIRKKL